MSPLQYVDALVLQPRPLNAINGADTADVEIDLKNALEMRNPNLCGYCPTLVAPRPRHQYRRQYLGQRTPLLRLSGSSDGLAQLCYSLAQTIEPISSLLLAARR